MKSLPSAFRAAALVLLVAAASPALGQGILFPRPEVREWPFSVKSVRVSSAITDGIAETTVEQTFVNRSPVEQEGTYLFPLPDGATVTSFSLRAGDRVIEGRLLGKDEARGVYESIVRRRRDPALLEYMGRGLFRASVFPIPPNGERVLTLRYAETLKAEGAQRKFAYPLSTGRFSSRPITVSSISVRLKTTAPLKSVYSPSHDVSVRRIDDHTAIASWEAQGELPDRDFSLYYATSPDDVGLSLLTYQSGDRDGYFMLVASPRVNVPKERILPKQVVFVLDRTGSMAGSGKLEQARGALDFCLDRLNPNDRFGLITFNESPDLLSRSLLPVTEANIAKAHRFVRDLEASGGTNIDEALRAALSMLKGDTGSRKMVVFLTDGQPTVGETNVETILAHVKSQNRGGHLASADDEAPKAAMGVGARIFCFGVGYDVNVPLLDRLSEDNRGDSDYVRPQESIEGIVSSFYAKVASPVLADLRLAFDGVEVYDTFPKQLPDLFKGSQLVVAGRYRGDGPGVARLVGFAQGHEETFKLAGAFGEEAARSTLVPRIWAARKIGYLLDQVRLHSNQEVIDEIVRLSKDYGILTPYTSYLADERQDQVYVPQRRGDSDHTLFYDVDHAAVRLRESEARDALTQLQSGPQGEAGTAATGRSLNAQGYRNLGRAPTSAQGGAGMGGYGGQRAGRDAPFMMPGMAAGKRAGLSSDYLSVGAGGSISMAVQGQRGIEQVQQAARMQAVGGRVFYRQGPVWFDNAYKSGQQVIKVKALSDAHFQLLKAMPSLSQYAAVGEEVVLSGAKAAVQIGKEGLEKLTDAQIKEITGR